MRSAKRRPYRLFEVTGIELEYPVVDRDLRVQCLVEPAFRLIAGRPVSELQFRRAGFSNEFAAHVLEVKTMRPERGLRTAELILQEGLARFSELLREHFGARLLPTGMHPLMHPRETVLWPRASSRIYRAYATIFSVRNHGWLNIQSCHVNLPFGSRPETLLLHNAIACLLPYLPALAASSPIYEGRLGPCVANRLAFYRANQRRIPEITGSVVPEFLSSFAQYRRDVLGSIYAALDQVDGGERLKREWVNSRGAILRFNRRAIEIRVLDTQECVKMDVAITAFIRGALRWTVARLRDGRMSLPEHAMLVEDFRRVVAYGTRARVVASHFLGVGGRHRRQLLARDLLLQLLRNAREETATGEVAYLDLVENRIRRGNLSERIARAFVRGGRRSPTAADNRIRSIYTELADCLEHNTPWDS